MITSLQECRLVITEPEATNCFSKNKYSYLLKIVIKYILMVMSLFTWEDCLPLLPRSDTENLRKLENI